MLSAIHWLDVLFGRGDDGYPLWLFTVRINILLFVVSSIAVVAWNLTPARRRQAWGARAELYTVVALTVAAGLLRFLVEHNVTALGGIGYSRILLGYKGHFGTAQLYSLVYNWTTRDLEHAILLNRLAATLTVLLLYVLCRRLVPAGRAFALITAALLALHPLHLLFTATDGLPISTSLLAVASYLLLVMSVDAGDAPARLRALTAMAAAAGLTLLTQVRYENVLFLVPPALYLLRHRRALPWRQLTPAASILALFMSIYVAAGLGSGPSYQSAVTLVDGLRDAGRELIENPIFAIAPVLIGTAAAIIARSSRVRLLAPLPLIGLAPVIALAIVLEGHDYAVGFLPLARLYANQVLPLTIVAGYGLALLWESRWWSARVIVAGFLLWAAALPVLYWPNLRERGIETVEHDFFRAALAALPAGIDRIVVPDDDRLSQAAGSTIEAMNKYRMIAFSTPGVELVEMTRFLENPDEVDCSRGNCLFFRGLPCVGGRYYWFAAEECAELMATHTGAPVREEDVAAGSFLDCSIYRDAARRRLCEPIRTRLGLYRITN